jgi:hypothetical protein
MSKFNFVSELKRQSLSIVGTIISSVAYVYSKFVPTSIPTPVSQSFLGGSSGGGMISLSVIALFFLLLFIIIFIVRLKR